MIYFDTAYIIKCYVHEHGSKEVRRLLMQHQTAACSALGRLEFAVAVKRAIREGRLDPRVMDTVFSVLQRDDQDGVWTWLPVTPRLIDLSAEHVLRLPKDVYIRSADALHLHCARENGFSAVYTNDRHMLAAASHFGMQAINVIP